MTAARSLSPPGGAPVGRPKVMLWLLRMALAAGLQCAAPRGARAESVALAWGGASYGGSIPAATQTALDGAAGVTHLASTN